jgi:RNA polymerase sigma-70 factor (ECF subfamily)
MSMEAAQFITHRRRLFGIAYRMLGVRADAEDVVQDAYLRAHGAKLDALRSAEAWLVTVVTRLCIDRLRSARVERDAYIGLWLPEPLVADPVGEPEAALGQAGDVSMGLMVLLERLAPAERAIFLLHQVFEMDHEEIAEIVGKSAAACRQSLHRARERVRLGRARFAVSRADHMRLLGQFVAATQSGERGQLERLFTADATLVSDGGGKRRSALRRICGGDRLSRLYASLLVKRGVPLRFLMADINGEPGLLLLAEGELDSSMSFDVVDGKIGAMYVVRNPDKLAHVRVPPTPMAGLGRAADASARAPRRPELLPRRAVVAHSDNS